MTRLADLSELGRLATEGDADAAVSRALRTVGAAFGAAAAHLVYGTPDAFREFGEGGDLELGRTALWIINRELTSEGAPLSLRVRYGRVSEFAPISEERAHDYLVALLPTNFTTGNMLVLRGPWTAGHRRPARQFLSAAVPLLATILLRRLRVAEAEEDRTRLDTLFSVGRVISQAEDLPVMLTRIATSVVRLVGVEHASIDIFAADGSLRLRCLSAQVEAVSPLTERWTRAAQRPDPVRNIVVATREPMIFIDAQNDERMPERARAFFTSTLIRSTAVFPLIAGERVVGVMSLASARPTAYDGAQRELIEGVAMQIAAAVQGVDLYAERREAEAALRRSEQLLTATIESTADGILAVTGDGRVAYANGRFAELWRVPEALLAAGDDRCLIEFAMDQLSDPESWLRRIDELYASEDEDLGVLTFKDGRIFERYSRPLRQEGGATGRVWSFRDVTERARTVAQILDQARRDSLTGALNHGGITQCVEEHLAQAGARVAVVMVDVDGMKAVNDTYGHLVGDAVLRSVAESLATPGATVGRFGGDEFLVVLPTTTLTQAEAYVKRAQERIAGHPVHDVQTSAVIRPPVSMGVALYPDEASTLLELIERADAAMYAAKSKRAIEEGHANRRLDDRVSRMIADLVPLLTSAGKLEDKLRLISARLSTGTGYDAVDCQIFRTSGRTAESSLHDGQADNLTERWGAEQRATDMERPINRILATTRRPIILEDLGTDERLRESERAILAAAGLESAMVAPMMWDDSLIGTLAVARRQKAAFDPREAQFLAAIASQVAAIVRMAALMDGLQDATERVSAAQAETVVMLAAAAEAHDHTTGLHLASIRSLSELIARELGYAEADVQHLGLAATLHDIGKISVPDAILSSPLRFDTSDVEFDRIWQTLKRHTVWGHEFLAGRQGFELAAEVARWHHERWDGRGYPDGLAGDAIPAHVAIVTVADALDAMVQDRPYRAGRSMHDAVAEIRACSGDQFSPAVVDAIVALYDRGLLSSPSDGQLLAA